MNVTRFLLTCNGRRYSSDLSTKEFCLNKGEIAEDALHRTLAEDLNRMSTLLEALGRLGSDRALDILFWLQSKEAWANDPPIRIEIEAMTPECKQVEEFFLRKSACLGIAYSGADRALHAFATGEGLADDLGPREGYFDSAAHARCGIYGILSAYRKGLEPEVKAALEAIFEHYGMEYPGEEKYRLNVLP